MKISMTMALVLAMMLALAPSRARAQSAASPFGIGIYSGDPGFGLTGKYWLNQDHGIQGIVGWSGGYYRAPGTILAVDWEYRFARIVPQTPVVRFGFDVGVGGGIGIVREGRCYDDVFGDRHCPDGRATLLVRVPVAFAAYFPKPQIEAFVEIVPSVVLLPPWGPTVMGGIGGRYYF